MKRSSGLLISRARDEFALERWAAMTDLGAPAPDDLVTIDDTGEIHGNGDALGNVFVRPPRPARCGWALASQVGVHSDEMGKAHFGANEDGERAVERCASITACPTCAAVIRGRRALDISRAAEVWHTRGGHALFLTLTLRHQRHHTLQETLDVLMSSWKRLQDRQLWAGSGKRAKLRVPGLREKLGMQGWIRSLEITYTDGTGVHRTGNGWHPHLHLLLLVDDLPMPVAKLRDMLASEWRSVVSAGSPQHTPSLLRGVDLQEVSDDGQVLAAYLAKVQGEASIGAEMARGDWKSGARRHGSWNPFEFLDETTDDDLDRRNAALWLEYVHTMHGRRVIEWSRGLRAELLPDDDDLTDDEVIADTESEEWRLDLPRKTYRRLRADPTLSSYFLDAAAYGEWDNAAAFLEGTAPPTGPVFSTRN